MSDTSVLHQNETSLTLLVRVQNRDPEAWRLFVSIYAPLIYWWINRQGIPLSDWNDVLQEVLIRVSQKIGCFIRQRRGSLRAWLKRITRNCCSDHFKNVGKTQRPIGGDEGCQIMTGVVDPFDEFGDEDRELSIEPMLLALEHLCTKEHKHIIWRICVDGASSNEVAEELKTHFERPNATAAYVRMAKKRILEFLKDNLPLQHLGNDE